MNITVENDIKIINMGEKGPNLLSVSRAKALIAELNYDECKAVILMGNEKVFSAGLNLKDLMSAKDPKEVSLIFGTLRDLLVSFREFPGPVISIVGGHAIAGGCLIALASDYRYGMFGMHRMGLNEMAIGIDLPPDMLSIISHSIGRENLFEVATQCKMYSPKQAYKKGLIIYSRKTRGGKIGDHFMICPPLVINKKQIDEICLILRECLKNIQSKLNL